ncbi:MAG TPA: ABC transporter permease [Vicinamibacterales bacterium]|nr:ABC transporter permease [Vicinamibacterales bacterium]
MRHHVEQILHDVRYGFRTFIRQPAFALTAILALALGIGANTAVFSVVYAILLKPLPFPNPDQLVYAYDTFPAVPNASVSWQKYVALRDGNRTLTALGAVAAGGRNAVLTGRGEPQQALTARVSGDFFKVFEVSPAYGRLLNRDDDVPNGGKVIALSYGLWQRRFGGDPRIVGQAITVDGDSFTVASVMPAAFNYPAGTEVWVPLALPANPTNLGNFLRLVGRMKPGTSVQQAGDDLGALTAAFNAANKLQRDVKVVGFHEYLTQFNRQMLLIMQGAVMFVLLVACANVANLLLARSVARQRELSIRAAIGAGRFRLVRQLLTESLMLAAAGGVVGVLMASWLLRLFLAFAPANFAGVQTIRIDLQVLTFTLAAAVLTGLVFGLAPARRGFQTNPNDGLRDTGARGATSGATKGASRALVVVEIGLAMILVVGAGLMVKSLTRLQAQNGGFRPAGVLTFNLSLPPSRYATNDRVTQTYDQLVDQIRSVPGVESVAAINMLPLANFGFNTSFNIVGRPPFPQQERAPILELRAITPGYFTAMGIPLLKGRMFTAADTAKSTQVVIINQTMAERFWPNANPIGQRLSLDSGAANENEIVGVVGDTRSANLSTTPVPESFYPLSQFPQASMAMVVHTDLSDPATLLPAVRQRIATIDPDLPIARPRTMDAVVAASTGTTRLTSVLTSVFGALAGLLASVGIYSLIAYSVAQRRRELGIRVALGADRRAVLRLIVGEGLTLAAIGLAIGLAGARMLTGTLQTMLFDVSPLDPPVIGLTCVGIVIVTAAASYIPARRAIRVDPMHALRAD